MIPLHLEIYPHLFLPFVNVLVLCAKISVVHAIDITFVFLLNLVPHL